MTEAGGVRYVLGYDTCGSTGSVALAGVSESGAKILGWGELPGRTFAARLVATIQELLQEQELLLAQLDALVVVSGPGSFTGERVGLSAAKGLCQGAGLQCVALSRLAVLAHVAGSKDVLAALDAGRNEIYVGSYREGRCEREALLSLEQLGSMQRGDGRELVVCEAELAQTLAPLAPRLIVVPGAAEAIAAGLPRVLGGDFDDLNSLDANYLRHSDAELFARAPSLGP